MIEFTYRGELEQERAAVHKKLRTGARRAMERSGGLLSSSGISAVYGIEWCREKGKGFELTVHPDGGCRLAAIEPDPAISAEAISSAILPADNPA
jgi:hypothetical protein